MSRFVDQEPDAVIPDNDKSVFDWCKEGQVERLSLLLTASNINDKDDQVGIKRKGHRHVCQMFFPPFVTQCRECPYCTGLVTEAILVLSNCLLIREQISMSKLDYVVDLLM